MEREPRDKWVSIKVSEDMARLIELNKDNPTMLENIIKDYFTTEKEWIEEELKSIDEADIKYKSKLIGLREAFEKTHKVYVEELEKLNSDVWKADHKLTSALLELSKNFEKIRQPIIELEADISSLPLYKLEKLASVMETLNRLSDEDKSFIKEYLLKTKNEDKD
jgi:type II secretory pathway predicted ATPase ExeA